MGIDAELPTELDVGPVGLAQVTGVIIDPILGVVKELFGHPGPNQRDVVGGQLDFTGYDLSDSDGETDGSHRGGGGAVVVLKLIRDVLNQGIKAVKSIQTTCDVRIFPLVNRPMSLRLLIPLEISCLHLGRSSPHTQV
jgi:hypothetical protein